METSQPQPTPNKRKNKKVWKLVLAASILLLAAIWLGQDYAATRHELGQFKNNPEKAAQHEADTIIAAVARHIRLPQETPTIATVDDKDKLQDQDFFKHAQNGDKVLMYQNSKKAILYRPSEDKIIEAAYLNIGETQKNL